MLNTIRIKKTLKLNSWKTASKFKSHVNLSIFLYFLFEFRCLCTKGLGIRRIITPIHTQNGSSVHIVSVNPHIAGLGSTLHATQHCKQKVILPQTLYSPVQIAWHSRSCNNIRSIGGLNALGILYHPTFPWWQKSYKVCIVYQGCIF